MPKISVLIPCYNAESTLKEALDTLQAQTHPDFEIVVVDDGSTDATPEILANREQADGRIRVIRQEHAGIVAALQAGLAHCRGALVARMDADDRCAPDRLAKQAGYLDAHPEVDVAGCLVRLFPLETVREGFAIYIDWLNRLVAHDDILREIFVESPLPHPSVMFRKGAVVAAGDYQDHGWPEDYDLWLRLAVRGSRFGKVPEVLVDWREHPDRLTRTDSRYSLENFLRAKAHYLALGPLRDRDAVVIWGAGMMGRRLSKHLVREGVPLTAFVDIDPKKIGRTRRGRPVIAPEDLPRELASHRRPVVLSAVGARGARELIRERLKGLGLVEGEAWFAVA
ncbi:MAG TPA: glycosyltransferase [Anaerolineales bacterium]|nr:glycosyltransferase [Anaerolineales bacterium]